MSTYDLPQEPELMVKSRQAAYCALRRLDGADDLTVQDMEDLIQTAALAYWKHHQEGRSVPYCFVCARQAAEKVTTQPTLPQVDKSSEIVCRGRRFNRFLPKITAKPAGG